MKYLQPGLAIVCTGLFAVNLWLEIWRPFPQFTDLFVGLAFVGLNLTVALSLWLAAWTARSEDRRVQVFWISIGLAQFSFMLGDVAWLLNAYVIPNAALDALSLLGYAAVYPMFLWGVFSLPRPMRTTYQKITLGLELLILFLSVGLLAWSTVLGPVWQMNQGLPAGELMFTLLYPVFDLVMFVVLSIMIFVPDTSRLRGAIVWLFCGGLLNVGTDIIINLGDLGAIQNAGQIQTIGMVIASYLAFISGYWYLANRARQAAGNLPASAVAQPQRQPFWQILLPYVLFGLTFGLTIYQQYLPNAYHHEGTALVLGAILILVIIVQLLSFQQNDSLNRRLSEVNQQLEARVAERTAALTHSNQELGQEVSERRRVEENLRLNEALYRAMVEDLPVLICRFLPDGTLMFVNEAYSRYHNKPRTELLGTPFYKLLLPEDVPFVQQQFRLVTPENPTVTIEHRVIAPTGKLCWQRWSNRGVFEGEMLVMVQAIGQDITDQRHAEELLRESEEKFRDLFDNSTDLIQFVAPDGRFVYVNHAWHQALGYAPDELDQLLVWDIIDIDCLETCQQAFEKSLTGESLRNIQAKFVAKDGRKLFVEGNANAFFRNGQPVYTRGIYRDVTERVKAEQRLLQQAYYDDLTGLPNRSLFIEKLEAAIERAHQEPGYNFGILFLDLDNFKLINDSLGHTIGDGLLKGLSNRLKSYVRSHDLVARLGGDEFVVLLDAMGSEQAAMQIAGRIHQGLKHPLRLEGHNITASASIGIILNGAGYTEAGSVLRDADIAMYHAKSKGKDRFAVFENNLLFEISERMQLENDLREAVRLGQFELHYQPIYTTSADRLVGFEALLRWYHPKRGQVPPGEFIHVADETGLIVEIGEWILQQAVRQVRLWQQQYALDDCLTINVNIAGRQLADGRLPWLVAATLQENDLKPHSLALEITENSLIENIDTGLPALAQLAALGVRLQIDDFGTGYSSLGRLIHIPAQTIKIDRSFIARITPDGSNLEIVRAILRMAKELGMEVVAEGVEAPHQLEMLRALDCEYVQGFLLSVPLNREAAGELLAQRAPAPYPPGSA